MITRKSKSKWQMLFRVNAGIGKNSLNYRQNFRKIKKIDLMNSESKSELCES